MSHLSNLQNIIADCVNETTRNSNHLLESLNKSAEEIRMNLDSVNNTAEEAVPEIPQEAEAPVEEQE